MFTRSSGVYSQTADPDCTGGATNDQFGYSVALSADGSTALVGAYGRSSSMGAAYVFTRSGSVYSQTAALTATGGANDDYFGISVALSADGNTALVGATGRNTSTGAAYVFTRSNGVYSQTATLTVPRVGRPTTLRQQRGAVGGRQHGARRGVRTQHSRARRTCSRAAR